MFHGNGPVGGGEDEGLVFDCRWRVFDWGIPMMKSLDDLSAPFAADHGVPLKLLVSRPGSLDAGLGHNFGASVVKRAYDCSRGSQDIDNDHRLPGERFGLNQAWQEGDVQYGAIHMIQAKTVIFSVG